MEKLTSQTNKCKNCGAELGPNVGGTITCNYCGSKFGVDSASERGNSAATVVGEEDYAEPVEESTNVAETNFTQSPFITNFSVEKKAPTKTAIYLKFLLTGVIIWAFLWVIRAALKSFGVEPFDQEPDYYDNILFSPIGGTFWILRGIVFMGLFPALMLKAFYNKMTAKYGDRSLNICSITQNLAP